MMHKLLPLVFVIVASAPAQSWVLRAEVDDLPGTPRRFVVEGAPSVLLTSTQVNLASIYDAGIFELDVRLVSNTPTSQTLEVMSAVGVRESFEIDGPISIGQNARFEVRGPVGAMSYVFFADTAATSFVPLPQRNAWLLGNSASDLGAGMIRANGEFVLDFAVPNDSRLIGLRITAQAAILDGARLIASNPDHRTIAQ